ncbi:flavodoxin family protein [Epibacterium sp. SM1979]|uniref:Flavodoxin family protein n=1 Tax=Tritonibacter litoralis TaxID=2662264 RepID=A0A843Y7K1_9RHOB|nr:NAD(P)H-dependent oxidoreductase [Tritonibacter litoralis]MQQ06941.1 flavodoxin family protein [Tritonibacter litoralis]
MHILTVFDHPNPQSFCAAVAEVFERGALDAGHQVERADLNAEGFDPRWTMADAEADGTTPPPADVQREQARIARADAICLVFPLFWWGMPAMTKGWIDRVWSWGWAYDQLDDPNRSLQPTRPGLLLVPAGAGANRITANGYEEALNRAWLTGTFGYFGFSPRRLELLAGSEGSPERRDALLARCYQHGLSMAQMEPC